MNTSELLISDDRTVVHDRLNGSLFQQMVQEIRQGLSADKKYIASKFFYDATGSALFEEITNLPEYYPGRTEKAILEANAFEIMKESGFCDIVELGSGDSSKIQILLKNTNSAQLNEMLYIPVDFSRSAIEKAAHTLLKLHPGLQIKGYVADFLHSLNYLPSRQKRLFCFLGGTIGNLMPGQAVKFLKTLRQSMNTGDELLLGLDMVKDTSVLEKAYNDSQQVTDRFNKNILEVINSMAGTNFDPALFKHVAFYNQNYSRIEMHLEALQNMVVNGAYLPGAVLLKKGETLHTENSYKFSMAQIEQLGYESGLRINGLYKDPNQWFSLVRFVR